MKHYVEKQEAEGLRLLRDQQAHGGGPWRWDLSERTPAGATDSHTRQERDTEAVMPSKRTRDNLFQDLWCVCVCFYGSSFVAKSTQHKIHHFKVYTV